MPHKMRSAVVQKHRTEFSERLAQALENIGYPNCGQTQLGQIFNAHYPGTPITVHAVRKWLVGETMPTPEKLAVLSAVLNVSSEWLAYGTSAGGSEPSRPVLAADEFRMLAEYRTLGTPAQTIARDFVSMLARKNYPNEP